MRCPACKSPLREKGAGGIWFDASELERVGARAATALHTIWNAPVSHVKLTDPRWCPRCPDVVLERKWFSDAKQVEIDQCTKCGGIWLDAGEFSRIYDEIKGAKVSSPVWATAMAEAAALRRGQARRSQATQTARGLAFFSIFHCCSPAQ